MVLKNPMKVNAICQMTDTMLCRRIGSIDIMREKNVFNLNMISDETIIDNYILIIA
jgi:hypothetical protein